MSSSSVEVTECPSCKSINSFVYDDDFGLSICAECGLADQDLTSQLKHSFSSKKGLIEYGSASNDHRFSYLTRNYNGSYRSFANANDVLSREENKEYLDGVRREELQRWVGATLIQFQQQSMLKRVMATFDHVKKIRQKRYLEYQKEREKEMESNSYQPQVDDGEPSVFDKFNKRIKPLRWGIPSYSIAGAIILLIIKNAGNELSVEELAAATNEPALSVKNLNTIVRHVRFLLGPHSEFLPVKTRDLSYELQRFSFAYLDFWVEQVGLRKRKEGKETTSKGGKEKVKNRSILNKEIHTYLSQALVATPTSSSSTSSSKSNGSVDPKTTADIKILIKNLSDLVINHSGFSLQDSSDASGSIVGESASYAIAMLAVEGHSKLQCPQAQFVSNETVHQTRRGAERLTTSSSTQIKEQEEEEKLEEEDDLEDASSKSTTIKSRYSEVKRFLQELSKELPWLQARHGDLSRDGNSLKRRSNLKQKQDRDLKSEGKSIELTRKELVEHLKEIVNYGIKSLNNSRKVKEIQTRRREKEVVQEKRDGNEDEGVEKLTWKEKYAAPHHRRKVDTEVQDSEGTKVEGGDSFFDIESLGEWAQGLEVNESDSEEEEEDSQDEDGSNDFESELLSDEEEEADQEKQHFISEGQALDKIIQSVGKSSNISSSKESLIELARLHDLVLLLSKDDVNTKNSNLINAMSNSTSSNSTSANRPHPASLPEFSMELESDELDEILFKPGELDSYFRDQTDVVKLARAKYQMGDWEIQEKGKGKEKESINSHSKREPKRNADSLESVGLKDGDSFDTEVPKKKTRKLNFSLEEFWEQEKGGEKS